MAAGVCALMGGVGTSSSSSQPSLRHHRDSSVACERGPCITHQPRHMSHVTCHMSHTSSQDYFALRLVHLTSGRLRCVGKRQLKPQQSGQSKRESTKQPAQQPRAANTSQSTEHPTKQAPNQATKQSSDLSVCQHIRCCLLLCYHLFHSQSSVRTKPSNRRQRRPEYYFIRIAGEVAFSSSNHASRTHDGVSG
jgi:hypothetical protein